MTASEPRNLDLPLTFLGPGQFRAEIWTDDPAAGPTTVVWSEQTVSASDTLRIKIPANGGAAMRLTPRASSD
jgi:alpha-glucosidase